MARSNSMSLKNQFLQNCTTRFPQLQTELQPEQISDQLLSPFVVDLPSSVLAQAQKNISSFFKLRSKTQYIQHYQKELTDRGLTMAPNHGLMMSYDFHLNENNELKLIEVNTNAAFLALGELMYEAHQLPRPVSTFKLEDLKACLKNELRLLGKNAEKPRIAIIDENPSQQRLYAEFLIYRELFRSWGWLCEIKDFREDLTGFDLIYNRYTDFYFERSESSPLKEIYNSQKAAISPHPAEYIYLADKSRMHDWQQPGFLNQYGLATDEQESIHRALIKSYLVVPEAADQLWSDRKSLFFKPLRAFGSKQTYKGASLSKKYFEEFFTDDGHAEFVAQEYVPAPERTFTTEEGPQEFKFDLRFYAYEDQLQSVVARLYQGQVTNLKTKWGGFAPVRWTT